jgi:adenylate kinase family enzyme
MRATPYTSAAQGSRVHIIGGPGSGKTRLSKRLGVALGVPVHDLDLIAGDGAPPNFLPSNTVAERVARVEEIIRSGEWVTEGSYLWWTDALLRAADTIIWLDPPRRTAMARVFARSVRETWHDDRGLFASVRRPKLRWFFQFVRWCWRYYDPNRAVAQPSGDSVDEISLAATRRALLPYWAKVIRCHQSPTQFDVLSFIDRGIDGRVRTFDRAHH